MGPLVSVICISYNHERFVKEALDSVVGQSYSPVELLIVDDASSDNTVAVIRDWLKTRTGVTFIPLTENGGNCKAFNQAYRKANGKYVIDLSADDVLTPDRIERGVSLLELNPGAGVQFSDAELIDERGQHLGYHSDRFPHDSIPQGKIFNHLLAKYFISSPTMMIRKDLLDRLGGFDESLAYEDFDFWVRSSPITLYAYLPEPLVKRRVISTSMGRQQYTRRSAQMTSTLAVCRKALPLCRDAEDLRSLRKRIYYELRQAVLAGRLSLVLGYLALLTKAR